jgi:hypothetical protein
VSEEIAASRRELADYLDILAISGRDVALGDLEGGRRYLALTKLIKPSAIPVAMR